jgi:hypothetical protein
MEKVLQYYFSWIASLSPKTETNGRWFVWTEKQSGSPRESVPTGDITLQELQQ